MMERMIESGGIPERAPVSVMLESSANQSDVLPTECIFRACNLDTNLAGIIPWFCDLRGSRPARPIHPTLAEQGSF
ncbi:hypothetical protein D9M68_268110 [compost metagenome]